MPLYIAIDKDAGKRVDKFICEKAEISRSLCKDALAKGLITVNGKEIKPSYIIKENDEVFLEEIEVEEYEIIPENLNLEYVYNDDDLCVVNKPSGLLTIATEKEKDKTLYHIVREYLVSKDMKEVAKENTLEESRISESIKEVTMNTTLDEESLDFCKDMLAKYPNKIIWQRSFHDHIIRNQKAYEKIWLYRREGFN